MTAVYQSARVTEISTATSDSEKRASQSLSTQSAKNWRNNHPQSEPDKVETAFRSKEEILPLSVT